MVLIIGWAFEPIRMHPFNFAKRVGKYDLQGKLHPVMWILSDPHHFDPPDPDPDPFNYADPYPGSKKSAKFFGKLA